MTNSKQVVGGLFKRTIDLAVASALVLVASPVLAGVAMWIRMADGAPILFMQDRAGLGGMPFQAAKFRSMRPHSASPESIGQVDNSHDLVTKTGRFIRRTKLDELPQLWNVIKGDMSLVGPRPTLASQADEYSAFQRRRLHARPGMTGWAQVNGNTSLSWEERILLDVWYVDHWSLSLDMRILAMTIAVMVRGETVNQPRLAEAQEHAASSHRSS